MKLRFAPVFILAIILAFSGNGFALMQQPAYELNDSLAWENFTKTEKEIFVYRELSYYRSKAINIEESIGYFVAQVDFFRQNPKSIKIPMHELVLLSILHHKEFDFFEEKEEFITKVLDAHAQRPVMLSGRSFAEYKRQGFVYEYDESGRINTKWSFRDGKREGRYYSYHANSNIYVSLYFVNDLMEDAAMMYYPDGTIKEIEFYTKGVLDGVRKKFYSNGQLKGQAVFKMGKPVGITKAYYENGKIMQEVYFEEGQMMSMRIFDEEGNSIIRFMEDEDLRVSNN